MTCAKTSKPTTTQTKAHSATAAAAAATASASNAASVKKIPRPPNSFLIYRKEHATNYAGLVATALSAKLAAAWKRETPERLQYYADLAVIAKKEHKLMYPDYKFTPAKRGTGKRARALAAAAAAAKEAGQALPATASRVVGGTGRANLAPKRSNSTGSVGAKAWRALSSSPSPEMTDRITPANRPKRNTHRPQRFSPCNYKPTLSLRLKMSSLPDAKSAPSSSGPAPGESTSSSLFFHSHSDRRAKSSSSTSSSSIRSQSREGSSDVYNEDDSFSDESLSSLDYSEDGDEEQQEQRMTFSAVDFRTPFGHLASAPVQLHQGRPRSASFQAQEPLFYQTTFTSPYTLENFEPECLPRNGSQWTAAPFLGSFPTLLSNTDIDSSCPDSFSEYVNAAAFAEDSITDFSEYANFGGEEEEGGAEKDGENIKAAVSVVTHPLSIDTVLASFPKNSMIPLSLLSPTTVAIRAMEGMSLSMGTDESDDDKTIIAGDDSFTSSAKRLH
ncbi:Casanova [Mortierella sp. AD031]|nr:Casanova [Mortierella sp. AD031]